MDERIVPAVTYFDYDPGTGETFGWVDYDDALVDAGEASQFLPLTDLSFTFNGVEYDLGTLGYGEVEFQFGRVMGFDFQVAAPPAGGSELSVRNTLDYLRVYDPLAGDFVGYAEMHTHDSLVLDTSESTTGATFLFTLSDGTLAQGEFAMDSEDVVSDGYAAVTDFELKVGGTTFTEADTVSTPLAHFVNGAFVGLSFDIQNITGQAFDRIVGNNGIITPYLNTVAQQPKKPSWETQTATFDFSAATTGMAYNIRMTLYGSSNPFIPLTTINVSVAATDTTRDIRDKVGLALKGKGIFIEFVLNTDKIIIGGNRVQTPTAAGTYALTKIEITTFTETNEYGPIPDNTICGPVYFDAAGKTKPIVKWNGNTPPTP